MITINQDLQFDLSARISAPKKNIVLCEYHCENVSIEERKEGEDGGNLMEIESHVA